MVNLENRYIMDPRASGESHDLQGEQSSFTHPRLNTSKTSMKPLSLFLGVAAASLALAAPVCDAHTLTKTDKRAPKFKFVGVNESGAEFGKDSLPGRLGEHYTWPAKSSIDVRRCFANYA